MSLLEQHFDVAFAAPDGIKKLRELILTLAMQGKLVPQDPNDEPANELLKEIEAEKKRLVKGRKIKQPKPLTEIQPEEVPYDLPSGWNWVRLGTVGNIFNGNSINSTEKESKYSGAKGLPYIATKDVGYGLKALNYQNGISIPEKEEKFKIAHKGAVLVCAEGGSAGKKCGITDRDICFGNKLFANELYDEIPSKFILFIYLTPFFNKLFENSMTGIIGGVSIAKFVELLIPLPPLAEQRRIVAKIDRLMARCDELEKLRIDRSQRLLTVHTAALDRLLTAKDSSEFSTAWSFITQHFGELYSVKENVVELRKTILQLAVMGKLVRQDPNDEPASELLRSIELEKQRLVKEGQIKQPETLPAIKPEEIPAQLPNGWRWGKIDTIVRSLRTDIRTGPFGASLHKADHRTTGIPVWGIESINKNGSFNGKNKIYVDIDKAQELSSFSVQGGDIIISRSGTIGELCQLPEDSPYGLLSTNLMKISLDKQTISPNYFCLLFKGAHSINLQLEELCAGSTRLFLTQSILKKILFPIPPLAEQGRIVEKIDRLMGICDRLEESIESGKGKQTDLLNALMSQV
jgi:type I restriction enzyme, S subunit